MGLKSDVFFFLFISISLNVLFHFLFLVIQLLLIFKYDISALVTQTLVLHDLLKSCVLGNKISPSLSIVQFDCNSCKLGKSKILPFPIHKSKINNPFDMIHSDLWGIAPVISHANYKYFMTFIDDYTRFTWVYFLRSKDEVCFKKIHAYVRIQFSSKIKILCSNNRGEGEYTSHLF